MTTNKYNNVNKLADPEVPSLIQELGTARAQVGLICVHMTHVNLFTT